MTESNNNNCPICGTSVSPGASVCPVCGADLREPAPPQAEAPSPAAAPTTPPTLPPTEPPQQEPAASPPPVIEEPPITDDDTQPGKPVSPPPDDIQAPPPASQPLPPASQPLPPIDQGPPPTGQLPPQATGPLPPGYHDAYDDESLPTLPWRPIAGGIIAAAIILIILAILAGAGGEQAAPVQPTLTPTEEATLPLPTPEPPTATATNTATEPPPPTDTPTITLTPTSEYCCQAVLEGDSMIAIVGRCGHQEWQAPAQTAVAINPNVTSVDLLPAPGSEVCVPWPTQAGPPTEEGGDSGSAPATAAPVSAAPTEGGPSPTLGPPTDTPTPTEAPTRISLGGVTGGGQAVAVEASPLATPTLFTGQHRAEEGETYISIALQYNIDMAGIATLNPQIDWSTCDFSNPGGGPGCNPPLSVSQGITVPLPTYTPTVSPTPSGSETPTLTPTPVAPMLLTPPDGATFAADDAIVLQWVPVRALDAGEVYLVHLEDQTSESRPTYEVTTRRNQITVPPDRARPTDGQPHTFAWTVVVAQAGSTGEHPVLSGAGYEVRTFVWTSE